MIFYLRSPNIIDVLHFFIRVDSSSRSADHGFESSSTRSNHSRWVQYKKQSPTVLRDAYSYALNITMIALNLHSLPHDILLLLTSHLPLKASVALRFTHPALASFPLHPPTISPDAVVRAVHISALSALPFLISACPTPRALIHSAQIVNISALRLLLDQPSTPAASLHDSLALTSAASVAPALHTASAAVILALLPHTSPSANSSAALRAAASRGNFPAVAILAPLCDASAVGDAALRDAAAASHTRIVNFLVECDGVNVGVCDGLILRHAARDGRSEVVNCVIGKMGARVRERALAEALENGRLEIVRQIVTGGWVGKGGIERARKNVMDMGGEEVLDLLEELEEEWTGVRACRFLEGSMK